jgi:hypothetical protein
MKITDSDFIQKATNPDNWTKVRTYPMKNKNFTSSQIKNLFLNRESSKYEGLQHCFKLVGKTGYINEPLFGLWMAGLLSVNAVAVSAR